MIPECRGAQTALRREADEERSVAKSGGREPGAERAHRAGRGLAAIRDGDRLEPPFLVRLRAPQGQHEPFFFDPDLFDA